MKRKLITTLLCMTLSVTMTVTAFANSFPPEDTNIETGDVVASDEDDTTLGASESDYNTSVDSFDLKPVPHIIESESVESNSIPTNLRFAPLSTAGHRTDINGKTWYSSYMLEWDSVTNAKCYYVVKEDYNAEASDVINDTSLSYCTTNTYFYEDVYFEPGYNELFGFSLLATKKSDIGKQYYYYVVAETNGEDCVVSDPLVVTMQSMDIFLTEPDYSDFDELKAQLLKDISERKEVATYNVSKEIYDKYGKYQNILFDYIFDVGTDQSHMDDPGGDYMCDTYGQQIVPERKVTVNLEPYIPFTINEAKTATPQCDYETVTYTCTLNYPYLYPITVKEEKDLTKAINKLCTTGELSKYKNSSDSVKAKACTEWVDNHCDYSTLGNNKSDKGYHLTAHAAYFDKAADCRGQALLLYRILRKMGVTNRIVFRHVGNTHLWNIVKIGNKWYSCDATSGQSLKGSNSISVKNLWPLSYAPNSDFDKIIKKVSTNDYDGSSESDYRINYVLNGGKNSSKNPDTYTKSKAVKLYKPTRKYYTFAGWYSDKKLTKKVTKIPKGSTGKKTLYAKWTTNKYNIKFNKNGGKTGKMTTIKNISCNKKITLPRNTFKRPGYKFVGWATSKSDANKGLITYKNKAKLKNATDKNNKTVTLYAVWKKK